MSSHPLERGSSLIIGGGAVIREAGPRPQEMADTQARDGIGRYATQAMERPMRERWEAIVPSPAASRGDQGGEAQTDAKSNLGA